MGGAGRLLAAVARLLSGARSFLTKPLPVWVAGLLCLTAGAGFASLTTRPVELVREVRVVERLPGSDRLVYRTVKVCDGGSILKALNEVRNSSAGTGSASIGNASDGLVRPHGGSSRASGDNSLAQAQTANATSGLANVGQIIDAFNAYGNQKINATNQVADSKAVSGDADASNEAIGQVGPKLASPSASPGEQGVQSAQDTPTPGPSAPPATASATAVALPAD